MVFGNIDDMNHEQFPARNPEKDKEMIGALIKDNLEEIGGHYIEGKSAKDLLKKDQVISHENNDPDEMEEEDDDDELEPWQSKDTSEDWKKNLERGILKRINTNDPSLVFYKILKDKFPKLGVEIKDGVIDTDGKYRSDYLDIYVDDDKGYRGFIKSLNANPIIELLCSPFGSRSNFEMNLAKVRSMSVLPEDMLLRIKSRYLYNDYHYHKKEFASKEILEGMFKEISATKPHIMNDEELKLLFESTIEEELKKRRK